VIPLVCLFQNIDKEFLRLWFTANCDPYKDEVGAMMWIILIAAVTTLLLRLATYCHGQSPSHHHHPLPGCVQVLPQAPVELISELSRRYVLLYETITGQQFELPSVKGGGSRGEDMRRIVLAALDAL
jgi:phosphoribosylaminoimidazole-succinocarboxamide synthase